MDLIQQPHWPPDADAGQPAGRRPRSTFMIMSAVLVGLLGSGVLVWQGTAAVFTATTSSGTNSWATGTITLTDDNTLDSAMFTATKLIPGATAVEKCVKVTYSGSYATSVKLYTEDLSDPGLIGGFLNLTVQQGTVASGGSFADCTGFVADSPPAQFTGTLTAFNTAYDIDTHVGAGWGSWSPTGAAEDSRVYRITYAVDSGLNVPNATATVKFTWEART
jgi:hypothetical protein